MVELIQGRLELVIDMEYQAVALGPTECIEHIIEVKGSFEDFKEGSPIMCSQIAGSIKKCYDNFKSEYPDYAGDCIHMYMTLRDPIRLLEAFLLSGKLSIDDNDNISIEQCEATSAETAAHSVVEELNSYHGKSAFDDIIQCDANSNESVIPKNASYKNFATQVCKIHESPILRMIHDLLSNMEIRSSRGNA